MISNQLSWASFSDNLKAIKPKSGMRTSLNILNARMQWLSEKFELHPKVIDD